MLSLSKINVHLSNHIGKVMYVVFMGFVCWLLCNAHTYPCANLKAIYIILGLFTLWIHIVAYFWIKYENNKNDQNLDLIKDRNEIERNKRHFPLQTGF